MKPDSADLRLERLSADEAPELQRALGDAKRRLPDAQQLAALAVSLSALGLPVMPLAAGAPVRPPVIKPWHFWLTGGVLGVGLVTLLLWRSGTARPKATTVALPIATSGSVLVPAPSLTPPERSAAGSRSALGASQNAAPLGAQDASTSPTATSASAAGEASNPPAGFAAPSRSALLPDVGPAPAGPAARAPSSSSSSEHVSAVASAPGAVAPPSELALLRDAQLALRTNPGQALALTEQHQARFTRGAMAQERELIAISALARLGRRSAVLARAAQFARDFPSSPYRKQIEALAQ